MDRRATFSAMEAAGTRSWPRSCAVCFTQGVQRDALRNCAGRSTEDERGSLAAGERNPFGKTESAPRLPGDHSDPKEAMGEGLVKFGSHRLIEVARSRRIDQSSSPA